MLQVAYNPSVIVAPISGVRFQLWVQEAIEHEQAPLLADTCTESSRGTAGEKPEVLLVLQTGEYCQQ